MTAKKKKVTEKGVLDSEIRLLMTPVAVEELKVLSPTMQQFLLRWQDHRDIILGDQLKEEMKEFLLDVYERDNEQMCKNVTETVCCAVAEVISPIWKKLEDLARGQEVIMSALEKMSIRLDSIEKRVFVTDEARLIKLEKYASITWTVIRNAITAAVTIGISIMTFLQIHKNLKP